MTVFTVIAESPGAVTVRRADHFDLGGPVGEPGDSAVGARAAIRAPFWISAILHGALLLGAFWLVRTPAADDSVSLESISVSIVSTQTASDSTSQVESDAAETVVAAGAPSPDQTEPVEPAPAEETQPTEVDRPDRVQAEPTVQPDRHVEPATTSEIVPAVSSPAPATATANAEPVSPIVAMPASAAEVLAAPAGTMSDVIAEPVKNAALVDVAAHLPTLVDSDLPRPVTAATTSAPPEQVEPIPPTAEPAAAAAEPIAPIAEAPIREPATARPAETATRPQPVERPTAKNKPTPDKAKPPSRANAGSGGTAKANAQAAPAARGGAGSFDAQGNAAETRYPGLVQAALRRALRRPLNGGFGEVRVGFTVLAGGGVSGIHVVMGSGSTILDRAAADTVSRAAPFPPIPASAGRSSWSFVMPLTFRR